MTCIYISSSKKKTQIINNLEQYVKTNSPLIDKSMRMMGRWKNPNLIEPENEKKI